MTIKQTSTDFIPDNNVWKKELHQCKYVMAPMVNQSELAFRLLGTMYGVECCYSPMMIAQLILERPTYSIEQCQTCLSDPDYPEVNDDKVVVQLAASKPEVFIEAANILVNQEKEEWKQKKMVRIRKERSMIGKFDNNAEPEEFVSHIKAFDLNLGCPQRIAKRGFYGAFLQEYQDIIWDVIHTASNHPKMPRPVTAKIRILEDEPQTIRYAQMIERAGAQILTVHGRTREQKRQAEIPANWDMIKAVREKICSIPVFSNGNIRCKSDADRCMKFTGCHAVMSACELLCNPALFQTENYVKPNIFQPTDSLVNGIFKLERSFTFIDQYLTFAQQCRMRKGMMKAHIYSILDYELSENSDLRGVFSNHLFFLEEYRYLIDELRHRCQWNLHRPGNQLFLDEDFDATLNLSDFETMSNLGISIDRKPIDLEIPLHASGFKGIKTQYLDYVNYRLNDPKLKLRILKKKGLLNDCGEVNIGSMFS